MIALLFTLCFAHAQTAIEAIESIDRAHREVRGLGETKNEGCWDCPLREPEICSGADVCRAYAVRGNRPQLLEGLPNHQREACLPNADFDEGYLRAHADFTALVAKRGAAKKFAKVSRASVETGDVRAAEAKAGEKLPDDVRAAWLELLARTPTAAKENVTDDARLKKVFADVRRKTARVLERRDGALAESIKKVALADAPAAACAEPNAYLEESTLFVCPQLRALPEATLSAVLAREVGRAVGPCPRALASVTNCLRGEGGGDACPEDAQADWIAGEVIADDLDESAPEARRRVFESAGLFAAHACKLETGAACAPGDDRAFAQFSYALFTHPAIRAKLGCPKTAVKHCD